VNTPCLETPGEVRWRVGHISDPIGFIPRERCSWNHRFDDSKQRFRALHCAIRPETALREVLADLRRNTNELARYLKTFGEEARADLPAEGISADWRGQNVLAPCRIDSDGEILDLTDLAVRHQTEQRHAALLAASGMVHLDIAQVTVRRRAVTPCARRRRLRRSSAALGSLPLPTRRPALLRPVRGSRPTRSHRPADPFDRPPPPALEHVAADWGLLLQPAPALAPAPKKAP